MAHVIPPYIESRPQQLRFIHRSRQPISKIHNHHLSIICTDIATPKRIHRYNKNTIIEALSRQAQNRTPTDCLPLLEHYRHDLNKKIKIDTCMLPLYKQSYAILNHLEQLISDLKTRPTHTGLTQETLPPSSRTDPKRQPNTPHQTGHLHPYLSRHTPTHQPHTPPATPRLLQDPEARRKTVALNNIKNQFEGCNGNPLMEKQVVQSLIGSLSEKEKENKTENQLLRKLIFKYHPDKNLENEETATYVCQKLTSFIKKDITHPTDTNKTVTTTHQPDHPYVSPYHHERQLEDTFMLGTMGYMGACIATPSLIALPGLTQGYWANPQTIQTHLSPFTHTWSAHLAHGSTVGGFATKGLAAKGLLATYGYFLVADGCGIVLGTALMVSAYYLVTSHNNT